MQYYNIPQLDLLTEKVLQMLPPQRPFFESNQTIEPYSKELYSYKALPIHTARQKPLVSLIEQKVQRLFNEQEKSLIKLPDQREGLRAGVVDHHGVLNHPVLIGVNIVSNFYRMFDRHSFGDILTFSTGNIPFNNFFYRRGFEINNIHVNLYPKKDRNKVVYQYPLYDFDIVGSLQKTHQWKLHTSAVQEFLQKIQILIQSLDFNTCKTIGDQITKINFHLWPLLFEKNIRNDVSNLISLEYDDLISDFLVHIFLNDRQSFIYQLLFNSEIRNKALQFFEGQINAWDEKRKTGTHFFWGLVDHEPVRMLIKDGILTSEDQTLSIVWNEENIIEALKTRKIFGGMFLKYATNILYAGIKPFAGYGSANSIASEQNSLIEFLAPFFPEEIPNIASLKVANLTSVPVLLHRNKQNKIEGYYAFDVMLHGGLPKQYFENINKVPIKYFMAPNLLTMYEYAHNLYGKNPKENFNLDPSIFDELLAEVII